MDSFWGGANFGFAVGGVTALPYYQENQISLTHDLSPPMDSQMDPYDYGAAQNQEKSYYGHL